MRIMRQEKDFIVKNINLKTFYIFILFLHYSLFIKNRSHLKFKKYFHHIFSNNDLLLTFIIVFICYLIY